jgi:hypothetical protein
VVGTPCEPVVDELRLVHVPDNVVALHPEASASKVSEGQRHDNAEFGTRNAE